MFFLWWIKRGETWNPAAAATSQDGAAQPTESQDIGSDTARAGTVSKAMQRAPRQHPHQYNRYHPK